MRKFMDEDFLLNSETARMLYHEVAEQMPIIDYHCHISPKEIAENKPLGNLGKVWLGGDHYKWRLMRACGCDETLVTGDASDKDKFLAFAKIMPQFIGNPMYHWSHLELQRAFGITEPLNEKNADAIYEKCGEILAHTTPADIMEMFHVKALCTTDDPCDDLKYHEAIAADPAISAKVLPAFRPDNYINIEKPAFAASIGRLADTTGKEMKTAADVADALIARADYFAQHGCLAADHGLDYCMFAEPDEATANAALAAALRGETVSKAAADAYKTYLTIRCAHKYAELGWAMQIHFGCLRNPNKPQFAKLGPDTGYDAINAQSGAENLAPLLNAISESGSLPKTILYSLNPTDNYAVCVTAGSFQGGVPGKMQMGSAWWFNDHRTGMKEQLTTLANTGVLARFVGMLTDSRSFLSYTRHEYFRRILCDFIGELAESGQYPADAETLKQMVADICFNNTNEYFGFGL